MYLKYIDFSLFVGGEAGGGFGQSRQAYLADERTNISSVSPPEYITNSP